MHPPLAVHVLFGDVSASQMSLLLFGIGIATGLLTGLTGASGMSVLISGLLLAGVGIREVIGLTFLVTLANSSAALPRYWREGNIDWFACRWILPAAVPMVIVGHLIGSSTPGQWLRTIMIASLMLIGTRFLCNPNDPPSRQQPLRKSVWAPVSFGAVIGVVMGLMGGGGGVFIAAFLMLAMGVPTRQAVGSSILIMGATAAPGLLMHGMSRTAPWGYGMLILIASTIASWCGAAMASRTHPTIVKRLLGVYLVVISSVLAYKTWIS